MWNRCSQLCEFNSKVDKTGQVDLVTSIEPLAPAMCVVHISMHFSDKLSFIDLFFGKYISHGSDNIESNEFGVIFISLL